MTRSEAGPTTHTVGLAAAVASQAGLSRRGLIPITAQAQALLDR